MLTLQTQGQVFEGDADTTLMLCCCFQFPLGQHPSFADGSQRSCQCPQAAPRTLGPPLPHLCTEPRPDQLQGQAGPGHSPLHRQGGSAGVRTLLIPTVQLLRGAEEMACWAHVAVTMACGG